MDWTEKWLDRQIDLYVKVERPRYEAYADFLGSVLGRTCEKVAPLAMVQVRTKAPASFAEKCVRQFDEHPNPVYQLTDLCGGRIIAQSSDQVDQFCGFIRQHFIVDAANSEDVQERLRTSEFGYRSVHFVVQVPEQIAQTLGLTRQEQSLLKKLNGDGGAGTRMRKAEIQVRTQIQHVWADNAHDRFYKTRLRLPREYRREVARLAALLEAADNSFGDIMRKVDAYQVDYGAYMTQERRRRSGLRPFEEHHRAEGLVEGSPCPGSPHRQSRQGGRGLGCHHCHGRGIRGRGQPQPGQAEARAGVCSVQEERGQA